MTITLSLSAEKEAELERRAAAVGVDVARYILNAVDEKLQQPAQVDYVESYEEWRSILDQWVLRQKSWHPKVDDSRESIYD